MPTQEDCLFLRSAIESGLLDPGRAGEVLAALAKVEKLGASSSAREIAVNRGYLLPRQADKAAAAAGLGSPPRATGAIGNFRILEKLAVGGMGDPTAHRDLHLLQRQFAAPVGLALAAEAAHKAADAAAPQAAGVKARRTGATRRPRKRIKMGRYFPR